jgi:hypothetical protein
VLAWRQVVWLSPVPRTTTKRGMLPGERDVRIGMWRTGRWAAQVKDGLKEAELAATWNQRKRNPAV